jgi:SAM-dependent methyltransferase
MSIPEPAAPLCPITGLPAKRRIQWVSGALLVALWRVCFGVRTARQLGAVHRFGLWEAPCGLAFFDPMIAGDGEFYDDFYRRLGEGGPWRGKPAERSDYARVAALIKSGERVLDVGCGAAGFSRYLPHARYVGLERSAQARKTAADVRNETIAEHAATHGGEYDSVCSFHVVEHVAAPACFAAEMMRCLRPGGRLFLATPSWPGAFTDIPNLAANGPPHHLTWWTEDSLRVLAQTVGLIVEAVERLPASADLGIVYWMARAAPKLTGERFFRHAWTWYGALLWSWLAGRVCTALFRVPAGVPSLELLLTARKPP